MFFQTLLFLVFVAEDAIEVKQKGPFNIQGRNHRENLDATSAMVGIGLRYLKI